MIIRVFAEKEGTYRLILALFTTSTIVINKPII